MTGQGLRLSAAIPSSQEDARDAAHRHKDLASECGCKKRQPGKHQLMTETRRLLPARPFPRYAFLGGGMPHPTRDPLGHSYNKEEDQPPPPDPAQWWLCADYLFGIDLFNHGFYWEAHEAWEGLWKACNRRGNTALFLKALINLAAAGYKARRRSLAGVRAKALRSAQLFNAVEAELGPRAVSFMGLNVHSLQQQTAQLPSQSIAVVGATGEVALLPISLWPAR